MQRRVIIGLILIIAGIVILLFRLEKKQPLTEQERLNAIVGDYLKSGPPKLKGDIILDSCIDEANQRKSFFWGNLRFGMTRMEYKDSLNNLYNYSNEKLIMKFDNGEMRFEINPVFENEYLQQIQLSAVQSTIDINTKLKEPSDEEFSFQRPFFTVLYTDSTNLKDLINLYRAKYGEPEILKGDKYSSSFYPDITRYIEWITEFNRSDKSDFENKSDSLEKYQKYVANITETLVTDTMVFRNNQTKDLIQFCYTKRISLSRIQLKPENLKNSRLRDIKIIYTPGEAIKYQNAIKQWGDEIKQGFKDSHKNIDEKLKKATKEGI